jgi:hypothetical protein
MELLRSRRRRAGAARKLGEARGKAGFSKLSVYSSRHGTVLMMSRCFIIRMWLEYAPRLEAGDAKKSREKGTAIG